MKKKRIRLTGLLPCCVTPGEQAAFEELAYITRTTASQLLRVLVQKELKVSGLEIKEPEKI